MRLSGLLGALRWLQVVRAVERVVVEGEEELGRESKVGLLLLTRPSETAAEPTDTLSRLRHTPYTPSPETATLSPSSPSFINFDPQFGSSSHGDRFHSS